MPTHQLIIRRPLVEGAPDESQPQPVNTLVFVKDNRIQRRLAYWQERMGLRPGRNNHAMLLRELVMGDLLQFNHDRIARIVGGELKARAHGVVPDSPVDEAIKAAINRLRRSELTDWEEVA